MAYAPLGMAAAHAEVAGMAIGVWSCLLILACLWIHLLSCLSKATMVLNLLTSRSTFRQGQARFLLMLSLSMPLSNLGLIWIPFFPNAKQGFPFHSGGLGVEGVFARRCVCVCNRSQPFAWGPYGRANGEFCNSCHFWRFQTSRSLVSRGRRGTLWHSSMFPATSWFAHTQTTHPNNMIYFHQRMNENTGYTQWFWL